MSHINRSVINMISGSVGYVMPMLLNLIFTPIILKNLGSEAYGLQTLVNVIIGFLMVADMGLDIPVTKFISEFKAKDDQDSINRLLNSTLQIYLLLGIFGMMIIFSLSPWLVKNVFNIPESLHSEGLIVFLLAGVGFLGGVFAMWGKSVFNGLQRYDIANGISIVSNLLSTIIGIILIVAGFGVVTFVFVRIFFSTASGLAYVYFSRGLLPSFKIQWGIDSAIWLLLKAQIAYGFVLRISGILFSRLDQTLIGAWIGIVAVGVYSIPYLITSSLIALIASAIHFIFPMASALYSTSKTEELNSLFVKSSRFVAAVSSLLFVPLILFGDKFLILWVGQEVGVQGGDVLILLALATYSSCLCNIVINSYVSGIGKLNIYATWAILRSIMMAVGCLIFIRSYGIIGAGISMLITCLADYIYFGYVIKIFLRMEVLMVLKKAYSRPISLAVVMGSLFYFARPLSNNWTGLIFLCTSFIFLYVALGFFVGIFGEIEKRALGTVLGFFTGKFKIKNV
ncbi:MAG: oligosaccharide flippase family protein [Cyclobacteriaceae bacterium]